LKLFSIKFDLSVKMGMSIGDVERLIINLISVQELNGFIDRETNEFVVHKDGQITESFTRCRSCGASFNRVILKGETAKCSLCNSLQTF
jgi:hypothetical protein